jgi:hypothetical protein
LRALAASLALFALNAAAGPVWLSLPDPAPCTFDAMSSALKGRLPGATIAYGHAPGADVQIAVAREGDGWTLIILAPGQPELRRPLGEPTDCVAFSEEAALIADRFLQSIQWTAQAPVTPLPPPEPPLPWSALLEVGGGATLGLTGLSGGGGIGLGARRTGGWQLEISAAFLGTGGTPLTTTTPIQASLYQYTGAAQVMAARLIHFSIFRLRLELGGGAELYFVGAAPASSAHPNPLPHNQLTLTPVGFGAARVAYEVALTTRLFIALGVEARLHAGQARFEVTGYPQHFVTHLVDGDAWLSLGYVFF